MQWLSSDDNNKRMVKQKEEPELDDLLALDGVVLVVDPLGKHWVKFVVKRVAPSDERPHGVNYSLTLHAADGERLVGFDNAHTVSIGSGPSRRAMATHDHRHRHGVVKPYKYKDAATLLRDFWSDVDAVLKEKGSLP
ncbi:MAG: DUF6516 family protein [Syntrophobacteraceae bacterium]|nr:DUF6516 family protein [Syntrophobacteraceae bacterium]